MRPKNKKDLKNQYGISYPTLLKWLKKIPGLIDPHRKFNFTPKEIELIYSHLGTP